VISLTIISASVALALIYALCWAFVPGVRRQIEQPKHCFQNRLKQYDRACGMSTDESEPADAD